MYTSVQITTKNKMQYIGIKSTRATMQISKPFLKRPITIFDVYYCSVQAIKVEI